MGKPGWAVWVACVAVVVVLAAGACGKKQASKSEAYPVGLVFDVGGIGDKSFNDAAYAGLLRARDKLGIRFEYFEPGEGTDREAALRLLASGSSKLILGVGFLFTDDIETVAREYPEKLFACVDYTWTEGKQVPPNLVGLKFREEEGSFLVGAIAGLVSQSGTVGFVGGMDIPLIHKFEAGYHAGVLSVRPDAKVLVTYAGVTGEAFKNPAKGKELALAQIDAGADVIYHASGSTGLGVFEAARARNKLVIGVDSDQSEVAPDNCLTSMVKQVDVAVFDAITRARDGKFTGGILSEGLKEGGVDYIFNERNARWITPEIRARVEELRKDIVDGRRQVPAGR